MQTITAEIMNEETGFITSMEWSLPEGYDLYDIALGGESLTYQISRIINGNVATRMLEEDFRQDLIAELMHCVLTTIVNRKDNKKEK